MFECLLFDNFFTPSFIYCDTRYRRTRTLKVKTIQKKKNRDIILYYLKYESDRYTVEKLDAFIEEYGKIYGIVITFGNNKEEKLKYVIEVLENFDNT